MLEPLPLPAHFDPASVGSVWKVAYQQRALEAENWAQQHRIKCAAEDQITIGLLLVDLQNSFCLPEYELFVAGRSGTGAIDDNRRLCQFIYRYLHVLTQICPTMDTHRSFQIFHSVFLVDEDGHHPPPFTMIKTADVLQGRWRLNPRVCRHMGISTNYAKQYLSHYVQCLQASGKYELTIWPYHAMIGGIGHALVSAVEETIFFHSIARYSQPDFQIKGDSPLTENYSVLSPEVLHDFQGQQIAGRNKAFVEKLLRFDKVIIAGQAKSHCVAWTIADLLEEINAIDQNLNRKIYLLEDCMSCVVVPEVIDYTDQTKATFETFARVGMHLVRSTDPLESWPDIQL